MVNTLAMPTQLSEVLVQYIAPAGLFQLVSAGSNFRLRLLRKLPLRGDELGFSGCLQLKRVVRKFLVDLYVGILRHAVVAARLKELLLHRNSPGRVDPEQDARASCRER